MPEDIRGVLVAVAEAWGKEGRGVRWPDGIVANRPTNDGRVITFRSEGAIAPGVPALERSIAGVVSGGAWVDVIVTRGELDALQIARPWIRSGEIDEVVLLGWPFDEPDPSPGDGGTGTGAIAHRPAHPHAVWALEGRSGRELPPDLARLAERVDALIFPGFTLELTSARTLPFYDGIDLVMIAEESESQLWGIALRNDEPGYWWIDEEASSIEDDPLPDLASALARASQTIGTE